MVRERRARRSANPKPKPKSSEEDEKRNSTVPSLKSPVLGSFSSSVVPSSLKDVFLHEWWLVKAGDGGGEGLALGGFTFRERVGLQIFFSTEITERHEATILKSKDGIIVTISSFINRSRTIENGFPPEVCSRFLLGFPFDWKDYMASCHRSPKKRIERRISYSESNVSTQNPREDQADLPATMARDLLLSTYGDSYYSSLMDSLSRDLESEKSRSCGGISTRNMTRFEHKETTSNSINGPKLEEHAQQLEKTTMKTRSNGLSLGVVSKARSSKVKPYSTTNIGRRSRSRNKDKKNMT